MSTANGVRPLVEMARAANRARDRRGHTVRTTPPDDAGWDGAPPDEPGAAPSYPGAVRLLDAPDEPPPAWLVADLIPKGEPVLVVGPDGSMKSTIALHLACAVAAGGRVFEHGAASTAAPVLVVSGEDPRGVIANRCAAIAKGHGWARERVLGNLHVLALAGTDLALAGWRAHLVAEVERTGAALVILDPLADLASGEENDNTERRAVVATWRALAAAGATPLLVHHAGKAGDGSRSKRERIRGASAIGAAARCTFFLEQTEAGVTVENLKQSRAERIPPFVVAADVTVDPKNRAVWTSAKFTRTTQRRAEMTAAERWALAYVAEHPGATSAQLREAVKAAHLTRFALSDAMNEETGLGARGLLRYEPGLRGARHWHLTDAGAAALDPTGRVDESDPTDPTSTLPGRVEVGRSDPTPPCKGGRVDSAAPGDAGRVDDEAYLADERAALEGDAG